MTFKKAEMEKKPRNGLSLRETDPLNHKQLDFAIWLGLLLHQFKKKLLLNTKKMQKLFYDLQMLQILQIL